MLTFLKKTKNHEISAIFLLYSIFLSIGFISFKDYGISVDEWELREHGFSYLIYICEIFCDDFNIFSCATYGRIVKHTLNINHAQLL